MFMSPDCLGLDTHTGQNGWIYHRQILVSHLLLPGRACGIEGLSRLQTRTVNDNQVGIFWKHETQLQQTIK